MRNYGFFAPLERAFHLLKRMPGLVAWAVLIAVAMAMRAAMELVRADSGAQGLLSLQSILGLASGLISGLLIFFLARTLLAHQTDHALPFYGRFAGLFIASVLIGRLINFTGSVAIFARESSQFMMTYGSVLLGSLGAIVTFPFLVRMLTAAAGSREPGLGGTAMFVFREGWCAYIWYAICAVLFPLLMVYMFINVMGPGNEANNLPGNLLQSVITGTGVALQYMLAVVVAKWNLHDFRRMAETFE